MRFSLSLDRTALRRKPWDVDSRLADLNLTRSGLLRVRNTAILAARDTTPDHCANAFGTFAYQYGSWGLRHVFCGKEWQKERPNNVEAIWNASLKTRVIFSNVDVACDDEQEPRPISDKGSGSERVCSGNLFEELPRYIVRQSAGDVTFYLMVDNKGAAELSRPVVSGGTFSAYIERIYLSDGKDMSDDHLDLTGGDDMANDFDPQVARKKQ